MSDDRDRLPNADRIRDRIREQRRDEYTKGDGDRKFDGVTHDPTFEQKVGAQDPDAVFKFGEVLDDRTSSLKWENVKESGEADQPDRPEAFMKIPDIEGESAAGADSVEYGDIEGMVKHVEDVVDHRADDFVDANDPDAAIFVKATDLGGVVDHKSDDVVDHKSDDVVDHKSDDVAGDVQLTSSLADRDDTSGWKVEEGVKLVADVEPDLILTNNENIAEWKVGSVAPDGDPDSILTQNENIDGILADSNPTPMADAFDDITGGDQPTAMGKQIDQSTPVVGDAADMKMELGIDESSLKMESAARADGTESGVTIGNNFEEVKAVASDPDNQDAFKVEIEGVDAGHVVDPLTDPVGDALAPLDGGDELISMPEVEDAVDAASPNFDDDSLDGA